MTEEDKRKLTNFETKVRLLLMQCDSITKENISLKSRLQKLETELISTKEEMRLATTKYENLKLAKMLSRNEQDIKKAQQKVSKIVREIDRCIGLIYE